MIAGSALRVCPLGKPLVLWVHFLGFYCRRWMLSDPEHFILARPTGTPCSSQTLVMVNQNLAPARRAPNVNAEFEIPKLYSRGLRLLMFGQRMTKVVRWPRLTEIVCMASTPPNIIQHRHVLRRAVVQQYIVDPVLYQLLGGLWWLYAPVLLADLMMFIDVYQLSLSACWRRIALWWCFYIPQPSKRMTHVEVDLHRKRKAGGHLASHHREDWHSNLWHGGVHGSFQTLGDKKEVRVLFAEPKGCFSERNHEGCAKNFNK